MLGRLLARGVQLDLGSGPARFRSPVELSIALSGRTGLSSLRIAALGNLTDDALLREADRFRELEQQISRGLARDDAGGASSLLAGLDLADVTEDHDWRGILRSMRGLEPTSDRYKKAALLRFSEYLNAGQALVRTIRDSRRDGGRGARADDSPGGSDDVAPRQALVFDLDEITVDGARERTEREEFNRMPKGETLAIEFGAHQSLSLLLARYRFTLVSGSPYLLVDENGNDLRLRRGKNIVGRSAQCDLPIDPVFRSVSRRHLIVEAEASGLVRLTDISTLGTFVPRAYLDNKLH